MFGISGNVVFLWDTVLLCKHAVAKRTKCIVYTFETVVYSWCKEYIGHGLVPETTHNMS